jgi:glycosyltransferase involved in cell wall biosynthesis
MSKQAQITVIVPVYNRAELMIRTLDSIAAQSLRPFELIVVDNNSTDNTLEVLHEWKEQNESADFVVTIKQEPRACACCARNKGLEAVKTPYVMFFDSDDTMIPTHIESALRALQADKSLDIVGWDVTVNLLDGKAVKKRFSVNDVLYNHIFHSSFATFSAKKLWKKLPFLSIIRV